MQPSGNLAGNMEPFLKWAGGKRWLVASAEKRVPETFNTYIEPFVGSGAMYFHVRPRYAILSDLNPDLIELYQVIRSFPDEFEAAIKTHHSLHSKEHYYKTRDDVPKLPVERAARTLYLNRTCWNGLYRVNLKGQFNVPIGTKKLVMYEGESFKLYSEILSDVDFACCDFEATVDRAQDGDFLFIDPPYTVQHNLNGFLKYNEKIFSWDDQRRLKLSIERALARGAMVVLTNADHSSVRSLYEDVLTYKSVERSSVLAADRTKRGRVTEALFYGGFQNDLA